MLGWILRLFSRSADPDSLHGLPYDDFEFGYSFEPSELRTFLTQLNDRLRLGLPVEDLVQFAMSGPLDEDRERAIPVQFDGQSTRLNMRTLREEAHIAEVHFSTPNGSLGNALTAQLTAFVTANER